MDAVDAVTRFQEKQLVHFVDNMSVRNVDPCTSC